MTEYTATITSVDGPEVVHFTLNARTYADATIYAAKVCRAYFTGYRLYTVEPTHKEG